MAIDPTAAVTSIEQLEEIYGAPVPQAKDKELDHLIPETAAYIEASPFVIVATSGPGGLDCSPRGDPAGFVHIRDPRTLLLPDRRGNNRVDTLRNLVVDPRIGMLFLVPGVGVTFRVNGTAVVSADVDLRQSMAMGDKVPATVVVVTIDTCYTQCPKALIRGSVWDPEQFRDAGELPSVGRIMAAITDGAFDAKSYDDAYPERIRQTIY